MVVALRRSPALVASNGPEHAPMVTCIGGGSVLDRQTVPVTFSTKGSARKSVCRNICLEHEKCVLSVEATAVEAWRPTLKGYSGFETLMERE